MSNVNPAVGCFGSSKVEPGHTVYDFMEVVGRCLAAEKVTVLTASSNGVAEAVSKAAYESGGRTIGFVSGSQRRSPFLTDCHPIKAQPIINTIPGSRNPTSDPPFEVNFGTRLSVVLHLADAFILAPGEGGTLQSLLSVMHLNETFWDTQHGVPKRLVLAQPNSLDTSWEEKIRTLLSWGSIPSSICDLWRIIRDPEEVVNWVLEGIRRDQAALGTTSGYDDGDPWSGVPVVGLDYRSTNS